MRTGQLDRLSGPTDHPAYATLIKGVRRCAAILRTWNRRPAVRQLWLVGGFVLLGIAVTWPRVAYLAGRMPNTRDQGSYAWDMWWMAHQTVRLSNPFTTKMIYAPAGTGMAYSTMMPLLGLLMTPVTLVAGGAFSANLLSILAPGLASYAMYRAARLWLPPVGSVAAGALFGLSSMLTWRSWFHLNIAAGAVFLPITLEVAVRFTRAPSVRRSVALGLVVGLCLLVDLESALLCAMIAGAVLVRWVVSRPPRREWGLLAVAVGTAVVVAIVQLVAMARQTSVLHQDPVTLARNYRNYGVSLTQIFAPSPRVSAFGLDGLGNIYFHGIPTEGMPTFGITLTLLAIFGAVVSWRRRLTRVWTVLWLGLALVSLGPVLYIGTHAYAPLPLSDHGQTLSWLMPYTWLVHLPGLSGFREANRFTPLALIPATLLAGSGVEWLRTRSKPTLVVVVLLAMTELGWSGPVPGGPVPHFSFSSTVPAGAAMPTNMPRVDRALAADHSGSLVVDVPLGFRSGTLEYGAPFEPEALAMAARDGHPRAVGYTARLPGHTVQLLKQHSLYTALLRIQRGGRPTRVEIDAASTDARQMDVGWIVVWERVRPRLRRFLTETGFRFAYRVHGVSVYRASSGTGEGH